LGSCGRKSATGPAGARGPRRQRPSRRHWAHHRAQREHAQRGRLDPEVWPAEHGLLDQVGVWGRAADAGI